jgi:hypothetical protein
MWGHYIAALSILHTSQQHSLAASISVSLPKRPLWFHNKRDYLSRPRQPTLPPSQWRGRPQSRARNIRREFSEQRHSIIVSPADNFTRAVDSQAYQGGGNNNQPPGPRCLVGRALHHQRLHTAFKTSHDTSMCQFPTP